MMTSETSDGSTFDLARASLITIAPRSLAFSEEILPQNDPREEISIIYQYHIKHR